MKKIFCLFLALVFLSGCSIPSSTRYSQLTSLTKSEKISKVGFGGRRSTQVKDFRENQMYPEDITGLKEEVEKYIAAHPDLSEGTKSTMRELKVSEGDTKDEVELLLGPADKISQNGKQWIYATSRWRAFTFFIFPFFFAREGYYLNFKDNKLVSIEKHFPRQIIHQASGHGLSDLSKPRK